MFTCCSLICLFFISRSPLRESTSNVCLLSWLRASCVCVSSSMTRSRSSFSSAKLATSLSLFRENLKSFILINCTFSVPSTHQFFLQFCCIAGLILQQWPQKLQESFYRYNPVLANEHKTFLGVLGISAGVPELDSAGLLICFSHIVFSSPTFDFRSFRARLDSASLSLEAANSSWRLAMLSSGTSSLWVLTSSSDSQIFPLNSFIVSSFSASFSLICKRTMNTNIHTEESIGNCFVENNKTRSKYLMWFG